MTRKAIGWSVLTLAAMTTALVVAYAAPCGGGAQAARVQMCPCPTTGGCASDCGCADGKPCACAAGGQRMAAGGSPKLTGNLTAQTLLGVPPVKVNAESEQLWRQLGDLMTKRHQLMWELFVLQNAEKPDTKAIDAKLAQIGEIERQMSVTRGALFQHRLQKTAASMGGGTRASMGCGPMMGAGPAGGCAACCAGAK